MYPTKVPLTGDIIAIRGGGDLATGVAAKFVHVGMRVVILETPAPTAIRRTVALSEAVYTGRQTVEDIIAIRATAPEDCAAIWTQGDVPLLVDPVCQTIGSLAASGIIDAILAKRNLGTMACAGDAIVVALGPGFTAPRDAHAVVETMRGHTLGQVIYEGSALPDTGTPGLIAGKAAERVLRAPCAGTLIQHHDIGSLVQEGDPIFTVCGQTVTAPFSGVLRGILRDGAEVFPRMKAADIDPRTDSDCYAISDKARALGGAALEAYLTLRYRRLTPPSHLQNPSGHRP